MGYGQFMCHQTLFELLPSDMSGTGRWTLDTAHTRDMGTPGTLGTGHNVTASRGPALPSTAQARGKQTT